MQFIVNSHKVKSSGGGGGGSWIKCDFTIARYGDIDKTCRLFRAFNWKPVCGLTDGNFFEKFCKRIQFQCYVTWMISENAHYRVGVYLKKKSKSYQWETELLTMSFSWKISVNSANEKKKKEVPNDWPIKYHGSDGCLHGQWCRLLWQCMLFFLIEFYFRQTTMKTNIVEPRQRRRFDWKTSIKYTQYFGTFRRLRLKQNLKLNNLLSLLLLSYRSHKPFRQFICHTESLHKQLIN